MENNLNKTNVEVTEELEFTFRLRDMYENFTYEPKKVKAKTVEEAIIKARDGIIGWGNCFVTSLIDSNNCVYCNITNLKLRNYHKGDDKKMEKKINKVEEFTVNEFGGFECDCGNTCTDEGFVACDENGTEVEPINGVWNNLYICMKCGKIGKEKKEEVKTEQKIILAKSNLLNSQRGLFLFIRGTYSEYVVATFRSEKDRQKNIGETVNDWNWGHYFGNSVEELQRAIEYLNSDRI